MVVLTASNVQLLNAKHLVQNSGTPNLYGVKANKYYIRYNFSLLHDDIFKMIHLYFNRANRKIAYTSKASFQMFISGEGILRLASAVRGTVWLISELRYIKSIRSNLVRIFLLWAMQRSSKGFH